MEPRRGSFEVLELDKVLRIISRLAVTPYGKAFVLSREPLPDPEAILTFQRRVTAAKTLLEGGEAPPIEAGDPEVDVRAIVRRAHKGMILQAGDLWQTGLFLKTIRQLKEYLSSRGKLAPELLLLAALFVPQGRLEERIFKSVSPSLEILDTASDALRERRRLVDKVHRELVGRFQDFIHQPKISPMLQEPLVTQRGGRFVVPVKETHRGQFKGIVHDRSSSGATLFMEPLLMVDLNNRLLEARLAEREAVEAVLRDLSRKLGECLEPVLVSSFALAEADAAFAAARWSVQVRGIPPLLQERFHLDVTEARHPLLGEKAVPIHFEIGKNFRTMVITGPNTGGKTVTLKTIGLFLLLAQCGLHVPAERASFGIAQHVCADIGDEQSIEQNLSTFSSHLSRILTFLSAADARTLVLLDELGAGTDPHEGAALAMALLHFFHDRGALVAATTHYPELKIFAERVPGMANASMTFHEETLEPSYKLRIGRPGRSLALTIASRLGLPGRIVEKAKEHLNQEALQVEALLASLERKEQELQAEEARLRDLRKTLEAEKETERVRLQSLYEEARNRLTDLKRWIRDEREALVHASVETLRQREKEVGQEIARAEEALHEVPLPRGRQPFNPGLTKPGDSVWVESLGLEGQVIAVGRNEALVQAGAFRIHRPFSDLYVEPREEPNPKESGFDSFFPRSGVEPVLHIRGLRLEEAMIEVEKYLDRVLLSPHSEIKIVHGKGEGILRKSLHEYLRSHAIDFRPGAPEEGGDGVTIVRLKAGA